MAGRYVGAGDETLRSDPGRAPWHISRHFSLLTDGVRVGEKRVSIDLSRTDASTLRSRFGARRVSKPVTDAPGPTGRPAFGRLSRRRRTASAVLGRVWGRRLSMLHQERVASISADSSRAL